MSTCKIEACGRHNFCAGLCQTHYIRLRDKGIYGGEIKPLKSGFVSNGYCGVRVNTKKKFVHVLVAEQALGKPLPAGAEVHHVNEDRSDNRPENLVICPDHAYHMLIHARTRAYESCGNADWRKCVFCKQYSPIESMTQRKDRNFYHRDCNTEYYKRRSERVTP